MKEKRVLSVHYDGKVYSVYEVEHPKANGKKVYLTFIGRKRLDSIPWSFFTDAVGSILWEIDDFDIDTYKKEWS